MAARYNGQDPRRRSVGLNRGLQDDLTRNRADTDMDDGLGRRGHSERRMGRSSGTMEHGFLGGSASKVLLVAVGLVVFRLAMQGKTSNSKKILPQKYYNRISHWHNRTFGNLFDVTAKDQTPLQELARLSTGAWNSTIKFKKKVLKPLNMTRSGRNKAQVHEKTGSRLLVIPQLLTVAECDELLSNADEGYISSAADIPRPGSNWLIAPEMHGYHSELLLAVKNRLYNLTGTPTHRHELTASIGTLSTTNSSILRHDVGIDPKMIATFIVFLSSPERGGDILFPTFGRSDKRYRNITLDIFHLNDTWSMPSVDESQLSHEQEKCPELGCRERERSLDALRQCVSVAEKQRTAKGVKKIRGGLAVPAIKGSAVLWYSRLRDGMPDPDMLHMHCPQKGASRFLVFHKRLPVTGFGDSATWDSTYNDVCEEPSSCT